MYTATISDNPISTPGTTPARNKPPIDTEMTPPQTTIRIDGGMMTPMTAAHAISDTVNGVS